MAHYAQLQAATKADVLQRAGGADSNTGTIVLATLGVLGLLGALAAAGG